MRQHRPHPPATSAWIVTPGGAVSRWLGPVWPRMSVPTPTGDVWLRGHRVGDAMVYALSAEAAQGAVDEMARKEAAE